MELEDKNEKLHYLVGVLSQQWETKYISLADQLEMLRDKLELAV